MHVFSQLVNAQVENKTTDYSAGVSGRIWLNTAIQKIQTDDGTLIRALLRNDQHLVLGNSGTPANNVRLNRSRNSVLQFLPGADTTAEGADSTTLGQISARIESYTFSGKPAPGNAGRLIFVSDQARFLGDDGTQWTGVGGGSGPFDFSSATLLNNQSSPVAVSGFSVDGTKSNGFKTEYSLRRDYDVYTAGSLDTTFSTNLSTLLNSKVNAIAIQPDGNMVVGGDFRSPSRHHIVRLDSAGNEDTTFTTNLGTGFGGSGQNVQALGLQVDNKIVVGGQFANFNGNARLHLLRLNSDGTEDTAFYTGLGAGVGGFVYATRILASQQILIAGNFLNVDGNGCFGLAMVNPDGTVATGLAATFNTNLGVGFDAQVSCMAIQPDGKIVLGGQFTTFAGVALSAPYLARLNSDGTLDTAFSTGQATGFDSAVHTLALHYDGRIIVGGEFLNFNGNPRNRLTALNSDGTEDSTFATNIGTAADDDVVEGSFVQLDGKVFVSGLFTTFNSASPPSYFIRLNSDGTLDSAYNTALGAGLNGPVYAFAERPDATLVIGGDFNSYQGSTIGQNLTQFPSTPSTVVKVATLVGAYDSIAGTWAISEINPVGSAGVTFSMTTASAIGTLKYTSSQLPNSVNTMRYSSTLL